MNLNSFSSFRRRTSVRTNTFVSRNKSSSVSFYDMKRSISQDNGQSDVEEMKSLFRHKHASIIDENKKKNNKDGQQTGEQKNINARLNSTLEDMGTVSKEELPEASNNSELSSDGRRRASSMDGKISRRFFAESNERDNNHDQNNIDNNGMTDKTRSRKSTRDGGLDKSYNNFSQS